MRAAVEIGHGVVIDNRGTGEFAADGIVMRCTAGMPATRTAGDGCRVQHAGVYQRRLRVSALLFHPAPGKFLMHGLARAA